MKPTPTRVPLYGVHLVRERVVNYASPILMTTPRRAAQFLVKLLGSSAGEQLAVIGIDAASNVAAATIVAHGGLNAASVAVSDVLRASLLLGTAGVILGHNHPSGDPAASPEDKTFTDRIQEGFQAIGLNLLDHVIVTADGRFSAILTGEKSSVDTRDWLGG